MICVATRDAPGNRRSVSAAFCLIVAAVASLVSCRKAPKPESRSDRADASAGRGSISDAYRQVASQLLKAGDESGGAYARLAYLTDHVGNRIAGSKRLDHAIEWAQKALVADGQENVRSEKVMVGHWERGELSLDVLSPAPQKLAATALGLSPGTGKTGIVAPIVIVPSFEALESLGETGVKGKIVVFNHVMPAYSADAGSGYGEASKYRVRGPDAAARLGAVAALTRSATARSLRTPHTGVTVFEQGRGIPSAAVATEDADLLARLATEGTVILKLVLTAKNLPPVASANVVGELRGRERPDEIVLLGAHLDSWDVGQGAQDDGAGCAIMMEALSLVRRAAPKPRRTIRIVLFTNEEHGMDGAIAYAKEHEAELPNHVAALESDGGSFEPLGLSYEGKAEDAAYAQLTDLSRLLAPLGATRVDVGHSGTDLIPLGPAGVPRMGHLTLGATYFDYHHTEADTLDKVDPIMLRKNAAMLATVAYVLADMPERLGR